MSNYSYSQNHISSSKGKTNKSSPPTAVLASDDASITHILVVPTSVDISTQHQTNDTNPQEEDDIDFLFKDENKFDDDMIDMDITGMDMESGKNGINFFSFLYQVLRRRNKCHDATDGHWILYFNSSCIRFARLVLGSLPKCQTT